MDASSNQLPKEPKDIKLDLKASPSAPCTAGLDLVRPVLLGQALPLTCDYSRHFPLLPARPTTKVRYVSLFLNLRAEVHRLSCILAPSTKPTPCDKPRIHRCEVGVSLRLVLTHTNTKGKSEK